MRNARRIGRRAGQGIFLLAVGLFVATSTWQLTQQVFFPEAPSGPNAPTSCEAGIRSLLRGVEDAKEAAEASARGAGEEVALRHFRDAISATWTYRPTIGELCQGEDHKRLLDAIDRLRYSEEHGVRKQASELSALRRRVAQLAAQVLERPETSTSDGATRKTIEP